MARLDLSKAQIVRADLGQLPVGAQTRKGQVRIYPAGEDQMQVSGLML